MEISIGLPLSIAPQCRSPSTNTMGSKLLEKKRKARVEEPESEDELAEGAFDGVLSQSDDDEFDNVNSDEENENDEHEDASEDEEEDDDGLLSDDIPSDVDHDDAMAKLVKGTEDVEITEPGVDPKRMDDSDDGRNYRIEKDGNGNDRYVYEFVYRPRERVLGHMLTGRRKQ